MFFRASQIELKNIGNFVPLRGAKTYFAENSENSWESMQKFPRLATLPTRTGFTKKPVAGKKSFHFVPLQGEEETKTAFLAIAHRNVAMMKGYGIANYGKPQTGTAKFARATLFGTIEPLEKSRQMLLGTAFARVVEIKIAKIIVGIVTFHANFRSPPGIAYTVFHKVSKNGIDKRIVAENLYFGVDAVVNLRFRCRIFLHPF